jgi:hypothetical protein
LTTGVEDILEDMRYRLFQPDLLAQVQPDAEDVGKAGKPPRLNLDLDAEEHQILKVLSLENELGINEIVELTGLPVSVAGAKLMMLELKKVIKKQLDGTFAVC